MKNALRAKPEDVRRPRQALGMNTPAEAYALAA